MKYPLQVFILSFFIISVSFSQRPTDGNNLEETFLFIEGQKLTLDYIKIKFPELKPKVEEASFNFDKNYGLAQKNITVKLQRFHQDAYPQFLEKNRSRLFSIINNKKMSFDAANKIISNTNDRAKGHIQPSILATLLGYQYLQKPENEFDNQHINAYEYAGTNNGKKLFLKIKIPLSWKLLDENSTDILYHFRSENGFGPVDYIIKSRVLADLEKTNGNVIDVQLLTKDQTKKTQNSANKLTLNEQKNDQAISTRLSYKPSKLNGTDTYIEDVYLKKGDFLITLQKIIHADNKSQMEHIYNKYQPLFKRIKESIQFEKEEFLSSKF